MRPPNGFETWHLLGRPRKCLSCGLALRWSVGRDGSGKVFRKLRCMTGEGAEGPNDWPHDTFAWFEDEEYGESPFA